MLGFAVSNELVGDAAALRDRAASDGYLFFRQLIDRAQILEVRRLFAELAHRHGWLDAGADPMDAISTQPARVESVDEEFSRLYDELQKFERFHALAHAPGLLRVTDTLFGEPTLVHPRNIGRVIFPTSPTTPPHQDFLHIQGTPDTWTAWIPLGDVPEELGGLAVLAGSHQMGMMKVRPMAGAGGAGIDIEGVPGQWHASPFEAGDVLMFHSMTIHAGRPNQTRNRLRLSCDYRYQGQSQPVVDASLRPHHNRLTWEQVYAGWRSTQYQYYWQKQPLQVQPYNPKMAAEYGKQQAASQAQR